MSDDILMAGAWSAIIIFVVCSVLLLLGILAVAAQAFRSRPKKLTPAEAAHILAVRQRIVQQHEQVAQLWRQAEPLDDDKPPSP